ncbi:acyl carrier protein [Anaerofustis stercorihominis]|uniref:Acyl carrier protein n=2 Tax=Anaerofustis stercorihominis TaxID=214853 RepID=B1C8X7_9FIRM|nr:acyl carrier protein [Anaerofustis stercorihominis]EDS72037.1 putative acyl carrier protein [Anaerofustis stercorihominis DSM 17244]MCQ4795912.1 acyl carrier protein [Anaerofustis stercorihominis]RGD74922.1 acyl carrier protein [Anaerofustis stercorihominis]
MIFERVRDIIIKQLEVNEDIVKMETSFTDDLDVDSLTLIELIADFEDEFGIEIEEDKLEDMKTVKDVVDYLEAL